MVISVICVYGSEVRLLEESIYSFLKQDFAGPKELIVYGTMPGQELLGTFPNVRLIPCRVRPESLGTARNEAIRFSRGTHIVILDADDIALPGFLSFYANNFDGNDWLMPSHQAYAEGERITKIIPATLNQFAFTRTAWESVGGYDKGLSVGEDRQIIGKITEKFKGVRVEIKPEQIQHIYRWGTGGLHLSGDPVNTWKKAEVWATERMRLGKLPCGMIQLNPNWKRDYRKQLKEFIGGMEADTFAKQNETCIVQMGRLGDIINMLPVAQHIAMDQGNPPNILVSREFASVLDGCSYVKPCVTDITVHEITKGISYARKTFSHVIVTQIYGHGHNQEMLCPSWPQESWRQGGALDHFHDKDWPLIFDKRDRTRESALIAKVFRTSKPKIVTNLTMAASCPFPQGPSILSAIRQRFGQTHEVVDIGGLRAERIYDLIGLYEKAEVIVSIDTATLHLAAAVPTVPLVALVTPQHWKGPQLRYSCAARIPYSEATAERVCSAISGAPAWMEKDKNKLSPVAALSTPIKQRTKLDLKRISLWACCWSEDRQNLIQTMRVLRYSLGLADFGEVIMFSYLPLPKHTLSIRAVQIPKLDPAQWNIFCTFTAPAYFKCDFSLSVHNDGFILAPQKWTNEFFNYDYIGASWTDSVVGNGGYALESRKFYEAKMRLPFFTVLTKPVQTTFGPIKIEPSDYFVCRTHRKFFEEQGLKFAPRHIASQFSTEMVDKHIESFGFHGKFADPLKYAHGWRLIEESETKA